MSANGRATGWSIPSQLSTRTRRRPIVGNQVEVCPHWWGYSSGSRLGIGNSFGVDQPDHLVRDCVKNG